MEIIKKPSIELQKKQNCIKANKLILNSSLKYGKLQESVGFLQNQSQIKLKVVYNRQK